MKEICHCCGHPLPDASVEAKFVGYQLRMFKILKSCGAAGINKDDLFERLYAHASDGGPQSSRSLNVYRIRMRWRLFEAGLRIETVRRGGRGVSSTWRLGSINNDDLRDHQHGSKANIHHLATIVHAGPKA